MEGAGIAVYVQAQLESAEVGQSAWGYRSFSAWQLVPASSCRSQAFELQRPIKAEHLIHAVWNNRHYPSGEKICKCGSGLSIGSMALPAPWSPTRNAVLNPLDRQQHVAHTATVCACAQFINSHLALAVLPTPLFQMHLVYTTRHDITTPGCPVPPLGHGAELPLRKTRQCVGDALVSPVARYLRRFCVGAVLVAAAAPWARRVPVTRHHLIPTSTGAAIAYSRLPAMILFGVGRVWTLCPTARARSATEVSVQVVRCRYLPRSAVCHVPGLPA